MPLGPISGGASASSTPGLPVWTYTAGTMAAGLMKTNSATASAVTQIDLSVTAKNGSGVDLSTFLSTIPGSELSQMVITDSSGKSFVYRVDSSGNFGAYVRFTVTAISSDGTTLAGDFQVSFASGSLSIPNIMASSAFIPVGDGTYTVGLGGSQNGTITTVSGVITAIQEAQL